MAIVDRVSVQTVIGIEVGQQILCTECGAWEWTGKYLRHAKRCAAPMMTDRVERVPVKLPSPKDPAGRHDAIERLTDDEVFDLHRDGEITTSEAMNRDS